jgi:hypothetical protein
MFFGFVVAAAAGMVFLPIAALFDPAIREVGAAFSLAGFFAVFDALNEGAPDETFAALGFFLWAVGVAMCVAPLAVAALLGEMAGVTAYTWYAGVSALLAAAAPWIARAAYGLDGAGQMSDLEGRFALLFFLTGTLAGSVYWLIAVRGRSKELNNRTAPSSP